MGNGQGVSPVKKDLASRISTAEVLMNWRFWYFSPIIGLFSILLAAASIFLSLHYSDWGFLSRFGALEVIIGSFLMVRPVWRRRFKSRFVSATLISNGQISNEQFVEYVMERTDIWFFWIGISIAATGSVVWGFADLINCFEANEAFKCSSSAFGAR